MCSSGGSLLLAVTAHFVAGSVAFLPTGGLSSCPRNGFVGTDTQRFPVHQSTAACASGLRAYESARHRPRSQLAQNLKITYAAGADEDTEDTITEPPIDFWCLTEGEEKVPLEDITACRNIIQMANRYDFGGVTEAVHALGSRRIAVEFPGNRFAHRSFRLPNGIKSEVQETNFGDGGLGYSIWDAGVALSMWISENKHEVSGKRVLELGSGVGLAGIVSALAGSDSTVLSDLGQVDPGQEAVTAAHLPQEDQPARLLGNLVHNIEVNALGGACEVRRIDWNQLDGSEEQFPVVIGSDLIYDKTAATALANAVLAHTAPGGTFCLMNKQDREGLREVLDLLRGHGEVLEERWSLHSKGLSAGAELGGEAHFYSTPLLFARFHRK